MMWLHTMNRKIDIRIWACVVLITAWVQTASAQVSFMVSGQCPDTMEKVWVFDMAHKTVLAQVEPHDGYFAYQGIQPLHTVLAVGNDQRFVRFFVDSIPVAVDLSKGRIAGSPLNLLTDECSERLDSVQNLYRHYLKMLREEWQTADAERKKEIEPEVRTLKAAVDNKSARVLKDYAATMVPAAFLPDLYMNMTLDSLDSFMETHSPYARHAMLQHVWTYYNRQQKKRPGRSFTDLPLADLDGTPHLLSEWCGKGHYVLLDFWASWCAPCRKEMPVVVESYVKYHRQGYEVIGISLDENAADWKTAVSNLGLDWTQLSELKGWRSEAVDTYGVAAIPSNILLNGEGVIVGADLRGDGLLSKLKEIFGY